MKVAVIPAALDQPVRIDEVQDIDLDYLQKQVGGPIQVVGIHASGVNVYLNEEGKLDGLPPNKRASRLAKKYGAITMLDFIVGDVVVVGPVGREGYDTGLNVHQLAWLRTEVE